QIPEHAFSKSLHKREEPRHRLTTTAEKKRLTVHSQDERGEKCPFRMMEISGRSRRARLPMRSSTSQQTGRIARIPRLKHMPHTNYSCSYALRHSQGRTRRDTAL